MVLAVALVPVTACGFGAIAVQQCAVVVDSSPVPTSESLRADRLLRDWAPTYVQRVDANDHGADRPTRIDFDGDWDTTNNWDRQAAYGTAVTPALYGAAIVTESHAYLTYTLYYPRDWSRHLCVPLICHDNDLETVIVVVELDGGRGRLAEVRAKAHLSISDTAGNIVARTADGRPLLHVEPEGHGIGVCRAGDRRCTAQRGRIVYAFGDVPSSPPRSAEGQTVTYELLSLRETLWARRSLASCGLWAVGDTGPLSYVGQRHGRLGVVMGASLATGRFAGGVRPPWGLKGSVGARGDWFLDPARGSERYVFNPFLDDLRAECAGPWCAPAAKEPSTFTRWFSSTRAPKHRRAGSSRWASTTPL